jgi:hypothetical protein
MKTRSTAMAEDSQNLANLQGQVTKLQQAKMATRAEVQNTREAIDRLTQMVQFLMDDRSRNQKKKKPITDTPLAIPLFLPLLTLLLLLLVGRHPHFQEALALGMASNPKRSG